MANNLAQHRCDTQVSTKYYSGTECSTSLLQKVIRQIMEDFPDKIVYLGVTHHPCSRFAGRKKDTTPLPTWMDFEYEFDEDDEGELLTEKLHYIDYEQMFLLCYTEDKTKAFDNEEVAVGIARDVDRRRVRNSTKGRNGDMPKSQIYWLYACVTDKSVFS